jgi:hypothetical protein
MIATYMVVLIFLDLITKSNPLVLFSMALSYGEEFYVPP